MKPTACLAILLAAACASAPEPAPANPEPLVPPNADVPVTLEVTDVRFFRGTEDETAIAVTMRLRARGGQVVFNSFPNETRYEISFNGEPFQPLSSPVELGRAAEERDLITVSPLGHHTITQVRHGVRHMTAPQSPLRAVVVRLDAEFRAYGLGRRYRVVSDPLLVFP